MMALDGGSTANVESALLQRVKEIVRRDLKLGAQADIPDDMPFFGGDFDLDSLDVLLLLTTIEKEFGLKIPSEAVGQSVFKNVATLTHYIAAHRPTGPVTAAPATPDPLARLPHQPPFRFVSSVTTLRPGESAQGLWTLTGDEPFFAGHFPGRPLVPGVLIAEALAQLAGLVGAANAQAGKLAQVNVRFDQSVTPPAEITLHAKVLRAMGALHQFEVSADVAGAVVARGELTIRYE